ncbi:MAG: thioredoxin family protein [Rhodococcus sp. (in: high G+C Gram-positive bacteria)]
MTGITVLVLVLVAATAMGLLLRGRGGKVRPTSHAETSPQRIRLLVDAGASAGTVTVLHFSADWCGPCAAVRRVIGQVLGDVSGPVELEVDIDAHPELARAMGVMSLPTTFVLDETLTETSRISGVPTPGALRSALVNR